VPFTFELTAGPSDIDDLGHVSNLVYLRWVQDAAVAHSSSLGWDGDAYRRLGSVWVVRRHQIDYVQQVVAGERIEIATWVESWKGVSSVRRTSMRRAPAGPVVCTAATTWVFVDPTSGRPRKIPDQLRDRFGSEPSPPPGW